MDLATNMTSDATGGDDCYPFKRSDNMRYVPTTRTDGNIDFMPSYPSMF